MCIIENVITVQFALIANALKTNTANINTKNPSVETWKTSSTRNFCNLRGTERVLKKRNFLRTKRENERRFSSDFFPSCTSLRKSSLVTFRFKIKTGRLAWLRGTFSKKDRHNSNTRLFVLLQSLASESILFAVLRSLISNESETDVQTGGN